MAVTLYERLGGEPKIARIVDEILALHLRNPLISPRYRLAIARNAAAFAGDEAAALARLKQVTVEFFSAGTGGPARYTGRNMREAHAGMNVSEQELVAVLDDVLNALERCGVGPQERSEVLAALYSMKGEVVRV